MCTKAERKLFNKAMAFMVDSGLIVLVSGVWGTGTEFAHFELAKTHTSQENEKTQ